MGSLGNTLDPTNHDSPIGALMEPIQKYTDPLSWVTGGKWADLTSKDIPRWTNEALAPITQGLGKIDKAINPLRKIPIIDQIGDIAEAKPADTIGLVVGSIFSGGALDGALAGGGGAAGAGASAGGVGAADAGTAAAIGAGAADAGTAVGLGSGLLSGTAGTALGSGTLAATAGTTVGATGGLGAAAGAAGGLGATTVGFSGVGNGIGSSIGAGAGQAGTGFSGFLHGAAAYGDSGLTGTVGTSGGFTMPSAYGSALGDAPTGLYSGLLPGGGMTGTSSGALGGGMSGVVDGTGAIGYGTGAGSTMGGIFNSPALGTASKWISAAQKANSAGQLAGGMNGGGQTTIAQPTARSPVAGRGRANAMPIPTALPMMSNPATSMMTMPGANALPTSTSSYQNLLTNMMGNSMQNPMTGLGSSSNFTPGAGGPMNPGYLIPGMY